MISLLNRKILILVSVVFSLFSLFFIYISVQNMKDPKELVETSRVYVNIINDCATKAEELGIEDITQLNKGTRNSLTLRQTKVNDFTEFLHKTTVLKNYCKKLKMESYCLGNECKISKEPSHQFSMRFIIQR